MKRLILLLILLVTVFTSQAYRPMLVEGRVWDYVIENPATPGEYIRYSLRCGGKALPRGDERQDKFIRKCSCMLNNVSGDTLAYVREAAGEVFIVDAGGLINTRGDGWGMYLNHSISLETLYDITLSDSEEYNGETAVYMEYGSEYRNTRHGTPLIRVESTDSVLVGGEYAKRQTLYSPGHGIESRYHVVEGLGVTDWGDFINVMPTPAVDQDMTRTWLEKVTDPDGTVIYEYRRPYPRLIRPDRVWRYHRSNLSFTYPQCHSEYYCRFDGTEVVNGVTYSRLCRYKTEHWVEWNPGSVSDRITDDRSYSVALLREEEGKVYLLPASVRNDIIFPSAEFFPTGNVPEGCRQSPDVADGADVASLPETILYDFTAADGDSWNFCPDGQMEYLMKVEGSSLLRIRRENCRQLEVSQSDMPGKVIKLIEGIGNAGDGNMVSILLEPDVDCDAGFERFTGVYDTGGNPIYLAPAGASIVNSGNTWEYYAVGSYTYDPGGSSLCKAAFRGTVDIDGKTYHKFVRYNNVYWEYEDGKLVERRENTDEVLLALMREENGRLYVRAKKQEDYYPYDSYVVFGDETGEYDMLVCDFNAPADAVVYTVGYLIESDSYNGGVINNGGFVFKTNCIVSDTGFSTIGDKNLKYVELSRTGEYSWTYDRFIESIGPAEGLLYRIPIDMSNGCNLLIEGLNGVYDNAGNKIFGSWPVSAPEYNGINDVTAEQCNLSYDGTRVTASSQGSLTLELFNAVGTRVGNLEGNGTLIFPTQTLEKGIYVARSSAANTQKTIKFIVR